MEDNAAVEIHDSTLERIESHSDDLVAVLSAYVHRSSGRPGIDDGTGWSQKVHLRFGRGRASGSVDMVPIELLDGHLETPGERFDNVIPMPFMRSGPVKIELHSWNEVRLVIEGDSLEATFVGEAQYVEQFSASGDPTR